MFSIGFIAFFIIYYCFVRIYVYVAQIFSAHICTSPIFRFCTGSRNLSGYAGLSFDGQILFPGMAGELSLPRYLRQTDGFPDPDRRSCLTVPVLFRKRAPHSMMNGCLQKRRESPVFHRKLPPVFCSVIRHKAGVHPSACLSCNTDSPADLLIILFPRLFHDAAERHLRDEFPVFRYIEQLSYSLINHRVVMLKIRPDSKFA